MLDPEIAVVGLGGNVGDVQATFRAALAELDASPGIHVRDVSSLYRTTPIGGPPQDDYLNAAVKVGTRLSPQQLLVRLHEIEDQFGRVRGVEDGPRTLDLDILWWKGRAFRDRTLAVPHPRITERRFALEPLLELVPRAGDARRRPLRDALDVLPDQGVTVLGPSSLVYDPT
jgi:2-amino-4-hydroxy-6-hydroxymethyldihydropteridine diphosphokinase